MPKQKQSKSNKELKTVVEAFTQSWTYAQNNYHSTWEKSWKLYNNQRVDRAYEGISDIFIPMTFSTIESMVSALAGSRPQFTFMPTNQDQESEVSVLNSMMDFYWDAGQWQSVVDKWIRSMLLYGTGVTFLSWDIDRPKLEIIPLRDYFFDPTASSPATAKYQGRRYLTTIEDLKAFEYVDIETGDMKKLYSNLDGIGKGKSTEGEQTDKEEKEMFLGSTLGNDAKDKQVEVLEYWTEDRVICVANRTQVIRDDENPYKEAQRMRGEDDETGIIPFVVQRNYQDESLFYGKGEIEPIFGLQESLNDLANQRRDAITYALNPMFTLDPTYADQIDTVESLPGAVYPFESGALQQIPMGSVGADSFNEEAIIKQDIRETTSADATFKGTSQDGSQTATEISAQLAQANQRLALKVSQIENEGFHDLAKLVESMISIFVTEPEMVKVIGKDSSIDFQEFDPAMLQNGLYEPRVQLSSTVDAKKDNDAFAMKEMYQIFFGDPEVNQMQLKRLTMQKAYDLDEDEIDLLLTVEQQEQLPPEGLPPGGEELPPELAGLLGGF